MQMGISMLSCIFYLVSYIYVLVGVLVRVYVRMRFYSWAGMLVCRQIGNLATLSYSSRSAPSCPVFQFARA